MFPKVPLNSPIHANRNPSFREQQKRECTPNIKKDHSWMPGHVIARRYANGQLDYNHMVDKVFEALDTLRHKGKLVDVEKAALSIIIPGLEHLLNPAMSNTLIRLSDQEKAIIRAMVVAKNKEILNWSAGMGGGSVPGRSMTVE